MVLKLKIYYQDDIDIIAPLTQRMSWLIHQNRFSDAVELFDLMQEKFSVSPNEDTYDMFICLFVTTRDKLRFMKFYNAMKSANVKVTSDSLYSDIIEVRL